MAFKSVALLESHWGAVCATLELGNDADKRNAAMIREQLSGAVKVTATRGTVTMKAPRGGDLRGAIVADHLTGKP